MKSNMGRREYSNLRNNIFWGKAENVFSPPNDRILLKNNERY
jgi:hypothetical protein